MPFPSMTNGEYVSILWTATHTTSKSPIITDEVAMTVIANDEKRKIRPTHPGEMLREDYLPHYGLTAARLAAELQVSRQTVHELLRERRAVSPSMALRLSRLFGNSPEFWLNAQRALDLYETESLEKNTLDAIRPMQAA
ncbi:MAG: HigA family addiction module antitoxin [Syntrophus sp. (in: bacteria)]